MKHMLSIIGTLMAAILLSTSCKDGNGDGGGGGNGGDTPRTFATAADAAKAAQADMIAAMEKGAVNFGVDKERLRSAAPGAAIMRQPLKWEALLQANALDSSGGGTLDKLAAGDPVTLVPLVNGADVVTVVGLRGEDGGKFGIGSLGDKQISQELDMVMKVAAGASVAIYEVPNLQATIYAVRGQQGEMYFTSYGGNSIREGMSAARLLPLLQRDAAVFERNFGDQVKKEQLVR
jgi:hypothetical protein